MGHQKILAIVSRDLAVTTTGHTIQSMPKRKEMLAKRKKENMMMLKLIMIILLISHTVPCPQIGTFQQSSNDEMAYFNELSWYCPSYGINQEAN